MKRSSLLDRFRSMRKERGEFFEKPRNPLVRNLSRAEKEYLEQLISVNKENWNDFLEDCRQLVAHGIITEEEVCDVYSAKKIEIIRNKLIEQRFSLDNLMKSSTLYEYERAMNQRIGIHNETKRSIWEVIIGRMNS